MTKAIVPAQGPELDRLAMEINEAHKEVETRKAYKAAYYQGHKDEYKARNARRAAAHPTYARKWCQSNRARIFLRRFPDCTSTLEEVKDAYATGIHAVSGNSGKVGLGAWDLMMGHVHNGPIVGLIWGWENRALTEKVLSNWDSFEATARMHRREAA